MNILSPLQEIPAFLQATYGLSSDFIETKSKGKG